jgi:hypothetical protein
MTLKTVVESAPSALKPDSIAASSTYLTNGIVFTWGAMTVNEVMMMIATAFGVATFFVNLHFQKKREKRDQELHEIRKQPPDRRCVTPDQ